MPSRWTHLRIRATGSLENELPLPHEPDGSPPPLAQSNISFFSQPEQIIDDLFDGGHPDPDTDINEVALIDSGTATQDINIEGLLSRMINMPIPSAIINTLNLQEQGRNFLTDNLTTLESIFDEVLEVINNRPELQQSSLTSPHELNFTLNEDGIFIYHQNAYRLDLEDDAITVFNELRALLVQLAPNEQNLFMFFNQPSVSNINNNLEQATRPMSAIG